MVNDQVNRKSLSTCNNKCQAVRGQNFQQKSHFTLLSVFISIDTPYVCNFGLKLHFPLNVRSQRKINHICNQRFFAFSLCGTFVFFPFLHRHPAIGTIFASASKIQLRNLTLFQQGGRDSPFCKYTLLGNCGLAISSPPPCIALLGDTHKARKRSCKDSRGFMTRRQVRLSKAYSHPGWEPVPYVEIYDEDDTADYSRLLKRIGHGPASGRFSVCVFSLCLLYGKLKYSNPVPLDLLFIKLPRPQVFTQTQQATSLVRRSTIE